MIPLDEVADHGGHVDRVVRGHDAAVVEAHGDVDRHPVGVGVVDRHRGVLQADRAVEQRHHGLALDLGVAVRHGHGRFLVQTREEFGHPVAAVVDDRLLKSFETQAGVGGAVLEIERAEHVHHVVGTWVLDDVGLDCRCSGDRRCPLASWALVGGRAVGRRAEAAPPAAAGWRASIAAPAAPAGRAFEEAASVHRVVVRSSGCVLHGSPSRVTCAAADGPDAGPTGRAP